MTYEQTRPRGETLGLLEYGALRQSGEDDVTHPVLGEEVVDELVEEGEGVAAWERGGSRIGR